MGILCPHQSLAQNKDPCGPVPNLPHISAVLLEEMEELSIKKIEGISCRENRGDVRKIAKQGINFLVLQLQKPWQSPLGTHHPCGGSWGLWTQIG